MRTIIIIVLVIALLGCATVPEKPAEPTTREVFERILIFGAVLWFGTVAGKIVWGLSLPEIPGDIDG